MVEVTQIQNASNRNNKAYCWALQLFMPIIVGVDKWKKSHLMKPISTFTDVTGTSRQNGYISVSFSHIACNLIDEAFMIVTLLNNWKSWLHCVRENKAGKSTIRCPYTSPPRGEDANNAALMISTKYAGWNSVGIQTYNAYVEKLVRIRYYRVMKLENIFMKAWIKMSSDSSTRKRKKRSPPTIVGASHSLFIDSSYQPDENDEHANVNPYLECHEFAEI